MSDEWKPGDTVLNPRSGYMFTAERSRTGEGLVWLELSPSAVHAQPNPPADAVLVARWVDGKPLPVVSLANGDLYAIRTVS